MNKNDFLDCLKKYTEDAVCDYILPVRIQQESETQTYRAATVYKMRVPDGQNVTKKVPYILHQVIEAYDRQKKGEETHSYVQVRSIFCVYDEDEQVGCLALLELVDRLRQALLKDRYIGNRYKLCIDDDDMEFLFYTEDIAPYFAGEMITVWEGQAIEQDSISKILLAQYGEE